MSDQSRWTAAALLPLMGLMLAHFTNDFYANFVPVFIPMLQTKFELSNTLIGLLSAIYTAAGSFLQLLFGYISDRVKTWRFVLFGPLITGFFMSMVGILPSYEWVLVALVLAAFGTAMFHPQGSAAAGLLFSQNRGFIVALFISAGSLGFALGPTLMALFLDRWGLEQSPNALLLLATLGIFIWLLQRHLTFDSGSSHSYTPKTAFSSPNSVWGEKFLPIVTLWGLVVFRHATLLSIQTFFLILMAQRGLDYVSGSLTLFLVLLAGFIGGVLGGYASDRWGRWRIATISLWIGFVGSLGFLAIPGPIGFISLLIGSAALNASNPSIVAFAQEIMPSRSSMASAIVMGFGWGVGGLLVGVVGVLADATQSVSQALWIATWVAFGISALLTLFGNRVFRRA